MSADIKARVERAKTDSAEAQPFIDHWNKVANEGNGEDVPQQCFWSLFEKYEKVIEALPALAADCERLQGELAEAEAALEYQRDAIQAAVDGENAAKRQCDREKERADRAEQAYADRMKTLAGFQLDSKTERAESLREQLATAQKERDQARAAAAKLNRRAQQLESELAQITSARETDRARQVIDLSRQLDQAKDHVRILSCYQRALEKGMNADPAANARVRELLQQEADEQQRELDAWKAKAEQMGRSLAETTQLMVHAKDFARNAAPILRLHKQLVEAAKAGDDKAVNRIVAELGLIESPL